MRISAETKIAALLRENPEALEAIVSLSPKFNKLRNPLLRKLMASRTTIGMASRIGGCTPEDFFAKLAPLGFEADRSAAGQEGDGAQPMPEFMKRLAPADVLELDVRPVLDAGQDPFSLIMAKVKDIKPRQALKLINGFEPIPLIQLLEKQGFKTWTEVVNADLFHTYFFRDDGARMGEVKADAGTGFEEHAERFKDRTVRIDVRHLEMPLPMLTILDELERLPEDHALYVQHKRIPVFLLPELEERRFQYRIQELGEGDVRLLIFRA